MKSLKRIGVLFVGILVIVFGGIIDLNDLPVIGYADYLFWPTIIITLLLLLFFYRKKFLLIFFLLSFSPSVFAGANTIEICNYYTSYKQKIDSYRRNYFKEDEPCDEIIWEKARKESEEYQTSLLDFVNPVYGVVTAVKNTVNEMSDGSCASDLMTLCSEYQRRHPETVVKTVPVILNEAVGKKNSSGKATTCWPCDMSYVVFTVIQNLSSNLSGVMAKVAFFVLLWITAFWLVYKAASMVLSSKGGTFFNQIIRCLLGVLIVSVLLKNNGQHLGVLYSRALNPVLNLGLYFSDSIQKTVGMDSSYFKSISGTSLHEALEVRSASRLNGIKKIDAMDYCSYSQSLNNSSSANAYSEFLSGITSKVFPGINTRFPGLTSVNPQKTLLTDELKSNFLCLTQKFYFQSRPFIAIGQSLVSFASFDTKPVATIPSPRFPSDLKMWFVGVLLIVLFSYFSFLVAFRIIDIFLRLGFVFVLMPLFVGAIVFPATREFTKKGWNFLFQVIVEFIGLALSTSFIMIMLESHIFSKKNELLNAMTAEYSEEYGENLLKAVTDDMSLSFFMMLIGIVIIGEKLLKSFPVIISALFEVSDSSNKGENGTLIGGMIGGMAKKTMGLYKSAKELSKTAAKNPHKTKANKAKDAEKDLAQKKKKLEDEKKKLVQAKLKEGHLRGTSKEAGAKKETQEQQKNVDKAQKDVDEAQKKADILRKEADKEEQKTAPSQSSYSARRFSKDTANAIRAGGSRTAQAIDTFGSKVGGTLMKNGLGSLVGVPLVLGTKALSTGVRAASKVTEMGIKGIGLVGAGAQAVVGAKSAPKKPVPKAPNPPPKP